MGGVDFLRGAQAQHAKKPFLGEDWLQTERSRSSCTDRRLDDGSREGSRGAPGAVCVCCVSVSPCHPRLAAADLVESTA